MTAAVTFRNGDCSSFQLHQNFLAVKRLWKQLYSRLSKLPAEGPEPWVQELPGDMDELPKPYVPGEMPLPEAEWPVPQRSLDELAARVPLRKSNRVVAEQTAQSPHGVLSGAPSSGNQLAAVVQAVVSPFVSLMMQGGRQAAAADAGPGLQILSPGRRCTGKRSLELQTPPREAAAASTRQPQQLALPPPPPSTRQSEQLALLPPLAAEEQPPVPPCPESLQSPPPKPRTLRDNALELPKSFQEPQENQNLRKAKTFARCTLVAAKKKPAACKKPAAATKQALSQSFACVVSRAYHAARNRALAAGQSKESAAEAARRAYRKAKAEFAA
ncbi:unnamed protein product [Symbiodinium microadriaticum]|nr:unnamed protein product [Symbiodinium microadriaticum]